jgi:hypothetical protein
MTNNKIQDDELFALFQTGTALARDQLFVERVNVELQRSESVSNFLRTAKYACAAILVIGSIILVQLFLPAINSITQSLFESLNSLVVQIFSGVICLFIAIVKSPAY